VRGANYLSDKRKITAGESAFEVIAVDLFEVPQPLFHALDRPDSRMQLALARARAAEASGDAAAAAEAKVPFVFAVNVHVPGPPYYNVVFYMVPRRAGMLDEETPFARVARPFFFGDDDAFRDTTFKLIPRISEGPFIVRQAVGTKPAILGTKLKQTYFRNEHYCELNLDIASSAVAANITRLALSYAKQLVVDMCFVFEGKTVDQLPERVVGCSSCVALDFTKGRRLLD